MRTKPWGSTDLHPWSRASTSNGPIGELWFERPGLAAPGTALLLKLLFTTEPLLIQVHPDDAFARSIGLRNGKTEARYILSAVAGAKVAVELNYTAGADLSAMRASKPVRLDGYLRRATMTPSRKATARAAGGVSRTRAAN